MCECDYDFGHCKRHQRGISCSDEVEFITISKATKLMYGVCEKCARYWPENLYDFRRINGWRAQLQEKPSLRITF